MSFLGLVGILFISYESRKREVKTRPTYECRCDERLKIKEEREEREKSLDLLDTSQEVDEEKQQQQHQHQVLNVVVSGTKMFEKDDCADCGCRYRDATSNKRVGALQLSHVTSTLMPPPL